MELNEIKKHWDTNAKNNKGSLLSTTKTSTIKHLEITAFSRAIKKLYKHTSAQSLLEVGCGNGHNLFGLAEVFPSLEIHGIDYSGEMIKAARSLNEKRHNSKIQFEIADVLAMHNNNEIRTGYDFVITDRMLINLNSWELQKQALENLGSLLNHGGNLIVIENFTNSHANQNKLRELIGLPLRTPDPYNKFLDEDLFEKFVRERLNLKITQSHNFGSLHDILLYVLIPHANSGIVSYDHPLMESVTTLLKNLPDELSDKFSGFGQNQLYVLTRS